MFHTEIAIVGAGVAGLAAARRLAALGVDFVVLEAKSRIGGRAHTVHAPIGFPYDLGCHWLHSADRNPLTPLAVGYGFPISRTRFSRRIFARDGWSSVSEREAWAAFEEAQWRRIQVAAQGGQDLPASKAIDRSAHWSPLFEAWFGILNGASPDAVSGLDQARYHDSGDNRQVRDGMGALIARYGTGVPVRLSAPVRHLRLIRDGVVLDGAAGRLRARATIVTVSTTVLGEERIEFEPGLPSDKIEAFRGLGLGHALRIAIRFPAGVLGDPRETFELFADDSRQALSFQIHPFGRPLAAAYAGAQLALDLERAGLDTVRSFVVERIAGIFGSAAGRKAGAAVMSGWADDPHVGGAYSFARPASAHLREALMRPVADRLWFAGEAASRESYSTAHGAFQAGRTAAGQAAAVIGRRIPR